MNRLFTRAALTWTSHAPALKFTSQLQYTPSHQSELDSLGILVILYLKPLLSDSADLLKKIISFFLKTVNWETDLSLLSRTSTFFKGYSLAFKLQCTVYKLLFFFKSLSTSKLSIQRMTAISLTLETVKQ